MAKQITQEMVNQVLDGLSADELARIVNEKRMGKVKEDIDLFFKTETEQAERLNKIRLTMPDWRPPTVTERIVSFLKEKKEPQTKVEIIKGIGVDQLWAALNKAVENGILKLKDDKYSVVDTEKK